MDQQTIIRLLMVASYLLGSLPFGLWIAKRLKGVDIRTLGSGNIGSTNVGRICGPKAGALVFCLDVFKGLAPPLVAMAMRLDSEQWQVAAGLLAIVGHNYSVWLGFKGGKGIATSVGALIGTCFKVVPILGGVFLVALLATRWVSLGSILGALALPVSIALLYPGDRYRIAFGTVACIMAVYKHRSNIGRLLSGTEARVHFPWDSKR